MWTNLLCNKGRSMRILLTTIAICAATFGQAQEQANSAGGGVLRALDKVAGTSRDIELVRGQTERVGNLEVQLNDCRFPAGNPAGDAFAELEIRNTGTRQRVFSGWMIASSPALSALEDPRYDIWVIRCTTS